MNGITIGINALVITGEVQGTPTPPPAPSIELREDGGIELREDGGIELRQ